MQEKIFTNTTWHLSLDCVIQNNCANKTKQKAQKLVTVFWSYTLNNKIEKVYPSEYIKILTAFFMPHHE